MEKVDYNSVIANHLVNNYDWGNRKFKITHLLMDRAVNKGEVLNLLKALIYHRYNGLKDFILYYEKNTVSYINDGEDDTNYLHYDIEDKKKFNHKALPYLRPQVLIIDMSDIYETGLYSHYVKFDWVRNYLSMHKKHTAIMTDVFIVTNTHLANEDNGENLNWFLKEKCDMSFTLISKVSMAIFNNKKQCLK